MMSKPKSSLEEKSDSKKDAVKKNLTLAITTFDKSFFKNKETQQADAEKYFNAALNFFPTDAQLLTDKKFLDEIKESLSAIFAAAKSPKKVVDISKIAALKQIGARIEMAYAELAYANNEGQTVVESHFREAFKYLPDDIALAKEMAAIRREHYLEQHPQTRSVSSSDRKAESKESKDKSYVNLVFQGGGPAGIAYLGAMREFANHADMSAIKRLGGASAGGIVALLLGLDYSMEEIEKILKEVLNLKELLDGDFQQEFLMLNQNKDQLSTKFERLAQIALNPGARGSWEAKGITGELKEVKHSVTLMSEQDFGLFPGDYFRFLMERFIQQKTGIAYLSFKELDAYKKSDLGRNQHFKEMYFIGANITTETSDIFSLEHTPDVVLSDALRITMSIPLVYKPHQIYYKRDGQRVVDSQGHLYVDGGVLDNQPIWLFDRKKYFSQADDPDQEAAAVNPSTFAFRLVNQLYKDVYESKDKPKPLINKKPGSLPEFVFHLIMTMYDKHESNSYKWGPFEKARTVYIDRLGVSAIDMDIPAEKQSDLIESGCAAVKEHFKLRLQLHEDMSAAISKGDMKQIGYHLKQNLNFNYINREDNSYLDLALAQNAKHLVLQLLKKGAYRCKDKTKIISFLEEALKSEFIDKDFIKNQLALFVSMLARVTSSSTSMFSGVPRPTSTLAPTPAPSLASTSEHTPAPTPASILIHTPAPTAASKSAPTPAPSLASTSEHTPAPTPAPTTTPTRAL